MNNAKKLEKLLHQVFPALAFFQTLLAAAAKLFVPDKGDLRKLENKSSGMW